VKRFLLGFVTALALVVIVVTGLLLSLGRTSGSAAPPASAGTPTAAPTPPKDLPKGATWLERVDLTSSAVVTADGALQDVRAIGSDVRLDKTGLVAGRLSIDAIVPFASAAAQVGNGAKLYAVSGGRAGITETLSLLGRDVPVTAIGRVSADHGELLIEPEQVDLGGPSWLNSGLSALARAAVTIRQPVQGVPQGMRLTKVSVTSAGFRAHLEGASIHIAD
jgi:hypothetical protein